MPGQANSGLAGFLYVKIIYLTINPDDPIMKLTS